MKFWKTILNKNKNLGKWREDYCTWRFAMIEEEKKIYKILHARFLRMLGVEIKEKNPINYTGHIWRDHISKHLEAKFTSIRKSKEHFYINDPATDFAINYLDRKPPIYIEINKETALKILTVGYIP